MKILLILLSMIPSILAAQSNVHFNHSVVTSSKPEKIWEVWMDVPNWKNWDMGLKDASLDGRLKLNSKGTLIPDKGPKSKFVVSMFDDGKSYTFKTRIPFGWLYVTRSLSAADGQTVFTHEVKFTGILKRPLSKAIGKRYREMLPDVMNRIKAIAENK